MLSSSESLFLQALLEVQTLYFEQLDALRRGSERAEQTCNRVSSLLSVCNSHFEKVLSEQKRSGFSQSRKLSYVRGVLEVSLPANSEMKTTNTTIGVQTDSDATTRPPSPINNTTLCSSPILHTIKSFSSSDSRPTIAKRCRSPLRQCKVPRKIAFNQKKARCIGKYIRKVALEKASMYAKPVVLSEFAHRNPIEAKAIVANIHKQQ